jgi:sulfur relay (sulfurtransferase) DsrC/TusE family protein
VRPQAGAWEREEINAKASSFHLTLTTKHWQLITF